MSRTYPNCIAEIYQDPRRNNAYFCKVTLGEIQIFPSPRFQPGDKSFEVTLNGPGRSKALKKVRQQLHSQGLVGVVLADDYLKNPSEMKILDRTAESG